MENNIITGVHAFDEMVGEIQLGELIVIAGRPCMGKTTLALQILAKNCLNKKCVYISILDNITKCLNDCCFILGNLNRYENEKEVLKSVDEVLKNKLNNSLHLWDIEIDFIALCVNLTRLKAEKGLDYVFIDDFQTLAPNISAQLRAKWLKELARSLDVTLFVTTTTKRSHNCDRIDCTTINYHLYCLADKVLGVYRKDFFMRISDLERIKKGESFLCTVKNNTGTQGAITAYFNYARCAFGENFIEEDWFSDE